jgi:hypothetical protein
LQLSNPSDLQRKYANDIYALIMSEIAALPVTKDTVATAQIAHENLALLYVASAQSLIKGMQLDQDTEKIVTQVIDFYKQASLLFSKAATVVVDFYKHFTFIPTVKHLINPKQYSF